MKRLRRIFQWLKDEVDLDPMTEREAEMRLYPERHNPSSAIIGIAPVKRP